MTATSFGFTEAIASWNADTPAGSWIEPWIRAQIAGRWTKWYSLGVWASGETHVRRHSVRLQGDTDGGTIESRVRPTVTGVYDWIYNGHGNWPAAPANEDVQRTYNRAELETVWLRASGGTVYLIHPPGLAVPVL